MSLSGNPRVTPLGEEVFPLIGLEVTIHSPASEWTVWVLAVRVPTDAPVTAKATITNAMSLVDFSMPMLQMLMKYHSTERVKQLV